MIAKSLGLAFAFGLCCAAAGQAGATGVDPAWKFKADTTEVFEQQAAKVREDMKPSGAYGAINVRDREAVDENLDIIGRLLKKKDSGPLSDRDQVDLVNAQEKVNAVLTRNDGNRLICTFERRSGSNFKEKTCITARDRDSIRRKSQQGYQDTFMKGGATQMRGN